MKAKTWRLRTLGAMALLMLPMMASASEGGAISFTGAIVAPQLQLTTGTAPAHVRGGADGTQAARLGSALTLTFSSSPGVTAGADVALHVHDDAPARNLVTARFVDSVGRVTAARNGHYHVGLKGGVLSLSPTRADTKATHATVVVSYQ